MMLRTLLLWFGGVVVTQGMFSHGGWSAIATAEDPVNTLPQQITVRPTIDGTGPGYYFSASHDGVASIAESVTMTRFTPVGLKSHQPSLVIDVPSGVRMIDGIRNITIDGPVATPGDVSTVRYVVTPRSETASKFILLWKADLSPGERYQLSYFGTWRDDQGRVRNQAAQSIPLVVVDLPKRQTFDRIPVWFTIPSDLAAIWQPDDYRRGGFNTIDLWCYLSPDDRQWGQPLAQRISNNYQDIGLQVWGWPQDWWWRKARESEAGMSVGIDGKKHRELNLLYRGQYFAQWLQCGRTLIDLGIDTHTCDPEIYRDVDQTTGYADEAIADFRRWLTSHNQTVSSDDPRIFMRHPERHGNAVTAWRRWRSTRYTDFFVEYRREMERYLASKPGNRKFRFVIYSTYHRYWDSFYDSPSLEEADPFRITLENPLDLSRRAFDALSPMTYPDLYRVNGEFTMMDMTLPYKDTVSLVKLIRDDTAVMPLLSTGYPFGVYDRDVSAGRIANHVLESFAGGARGFGFWGEGVHDARDMDRVAKVVDQLVPMEDVFLTGNPVAVSTRHGRVHCRTIQSKAGMFILFSEYSGKPLSDRIALPGGGRVRTLGEAFRTVDRDADGYYLNVTLDKIRAVGFEYRPDTISR